MISTLFHTNCVRTQYSNSTLECETTFCFLLFYNIKFSPTKTQYLEVDLQSSQDPFSLKKNQDPVQSAFEDLTLV